MLLLQIFRGALLGGGGLALGNGIALSYGGGHKVVTYVAWYALAALLLAAGVVFWVEIHRRKEGSSEKTPFIAPNGPPQTRIYGGAAIGTTIRSQPGLADGERSEREKRDMVEAEFVTMIEEGKRLCDREFTGELNWSDFHPWWTGIMGFTGTVLGDAERQRLIEIEAAGEKTPRNQIVAVLEWLRERRDNPSLWDAQVAELDGPELAAAIKARRRPPFANRLDALMREGMGLLDELMAPAQAEETGEGEWALEFGDAPPEWNDKANAFYKTIKDLLAAEHPALIPDFEKGYNERLRIQRERRKVARERPDNRSQAQRTLDFATDMQRTPAKVVEACLEGLSQARKSYLVLTGHPML